MVLNQRLTAGLLFGLQGIYKNQDGSRIRIYEILYEMGGGAAETSGYKEQMRRLIPSSSTHSLHNRRIHFVFTLNHIAGFVFHSQSKRRQVALFAKDLM